MPKYESNSLNFILFVLLVPGLIAFVQITQLWTVIVCGIEKFRRRLALIPVLALPIEIAMAYTQGNLAGNFNTSETTPLRFSGWALAAFLALSSFRLASGGQAKRKQPFPDVLPSERSPSSALFTEALLATTYLGASFLFSWSWELLDPLHPGDDMGYFRRACSVTALLTLCLWFLREALRSLSKHKDETMTDSCGCLLLDPLLLWGSLFLASKSRYEEMASLLGSASFMWLEALMDFLEAMPWACVVYLFVLLAILRLSLEGKSASRQFRRGIVALGMASLPWLVLVAVARPLVAAGKADAIAHRWQCTPGHADPKKNVVFVWDLCETLEKHSKDRGAEFFSFPRKPSWLLWPIHGGAVTSYCLAKVEEETLLVMVPPGRCEQRQVATVSLLGTSWKTSVEPSQLSSPGQRVEGSFRVAGLEKRWLDVQPLKPYPLIRRSILEVLGFSSDEDPLLLVRATLPSGRSRNLFLRLD